MNLTKNFTLAELTTCRHADIDNSPSPEVIANLERLAKTILQPLRDGFDKSVLVRSGYRSPKFNERVGGSLKSEHLFGLAGDIDIPPFTNVDIIKMAVKLNLPFAQIIDEELWALLNGRVFVKQQWIHISVPFPGQEPKRVIKTARNDKFNRKPVYTVITNQYR